MNHTFVKHTHKMSASRRLKDMLAAKKDERDREDAEHLKYDKTNLKCVGSACKVRTFTMLLHVEAPHYVKSSSSTTLI